MEIFLAWYNIPFWAPIFLGMIFAVMQAFGGDHGHGGGASHDVHIGGDFHAAGHLHGSVGHEVGAHGAHHDVHTGGGMARILAALGIGRVPITIIIMALLFLFGFIGLASNLLLKPILLTPNVFFWISLPAAGVLGLLGTALISKPMARLIPTNESFESGPEIFLGTGADAFYRITDSSGAVRVLDQYQISRELKVRLFPGESEIEKGERVLLARYDPETETFFARRHPTAPKRIGN